MSEKPESPIKDKVLSNPLNPFSERVGRTTETFSYRTTINGESVFIIESVDINLNGNTGSTKGISLSGDSIKGSIDSLSEENKALVTEALTNNSERDEAYKKRMQKVREQAEKNGKLEEFDKALAANNNLEAITGNGSFSKNGPETNKMRNDEKIRLENEANETKIQKFEESHQVKKEELKYPIDMMTDTQDSQDYIYIEQYAYSPPQPQSNKAEPSEVLSSGLKRSTNIEERFGGCKLPIPNKLGVSNGVNWGEGRANALELSAFQAAQGGIQNVLKEPGGILKVVEKGLKETGNTLQTLRKDINNSSIGPNEISAGTVLSGVLAKSALGSIGINVDVEQFITRQTGAAINPNLELLFGGPQLRTFSFAFNFAPNGQEEATVVRKIQRWFKQGMLPSRRRATSTAESSLFLASPNVFKISYMNHNRRIKGLNLIKICALTSVQVDFTPDGTYQSYNDGNAVSMPIRSTMGLTFSELTPIFRDDYAQNSDDPSITDLGLSVSGDNALDDTDIGF